MAVKATLSCAYCGNLFYCSPSSLTPVSEHLTTKETRVAKEKTRGCQEVVLHVLGGESFCSTSGLAVQLAKRRGLCNSFRDPFKNRFLTLEAR